MRQNNNENKIDPQVIPTTRFRTGSKHFNGSVQMFPFFLTLDPKRWRYTTVAEYLTPVIGLSLEVK